jgi:putative transposase
MGQTFSNDLEPIVGMEPIVGFTDESSLSSDPARRRVINTPVVEYSEGEGKRRSWTTFAFMALNGKDVVWVSEKAKAPDMVEFLEVIREENGGAQKEGSGTVRPIVMILDNARVHIASVVKKKAQSLRITEAFLPPYSPDLNPIEFGWKDWKRELGAYPDFDDSIYMAKETALNLFSQRKSSYAKSWICKFICPKGPLSNKLVD